MVLIRGKRQRGINQEFGISRHELLYIEGKNNKVLLRSTGNYIQYFVISHNGKMHKKVCVYAHVYVCVCVCMYKFSSVTQSCPTLCDPMNCSTPGLPVHHQLLEFTQTQVHRVSDVIQPSHPLASRSPPAPNPSQHQSLFQ